MVEFLPSKQVVAGSSPVSRSIKLDDYLPRFSRVIIINTILVSPEFQRTSGVD